MPDHRGVVVVVVALLLILAAAVCVLLAVAFPYRGRSTGPFPWLGEALGRLVRRVRPSEPNPPYALLVDPDRDARMRAAAERVERSILDLPRKAVGRGGS